MSAEMAVLQARVNLPRSAFVVDEKFNSRSSYAGVKELAEDIKTNTLYNPVVAMQEGDKYKLLMGFRRFKAMEILGWEQIPTTLVNFPKSDKKAVATEALVMNLGENL